MSLDEFRAKLSSKQQNALPDSAFAHIEAGGKKDAEGKTTPRKLRHYPVHDKPHADDALARANAQAADGDEAAKTIAKAALPNIKAAVKKFADAEEKKSAAWDAEHREGTSYNDMQSLLESAVAEEYAGEKGSDDYCYTYVSDFGDDWLVFSKSGEKQRCSYELDGKVVTLGDPEPVRTVTTYEPIEIKSAPRNPTPKRALSALVEVAPPRVVDVQVRMTEDDEKIDPYEARFLGYAYTIDERYAVSDFLGEYKEAIGPGASSKTLREQTSIPLLLNHDGLPMANTSSGTSRLSDDGKGLRNEADFDRHQGLTNDVCIALRRKDIDKMSFSFRAIQDAWNDTYDDRYVTELRLYDTSIVTYPANPATTAELQDEMRSALGREGRSLWLADHELSMRSAFGVMVERHEPDGDTSEMLERALRALTHADEVVCRSKGPHGRARTFLVANAMLELRAGKPLSSKNEGLLKSALDALGAADKKHQELAASHTEAADKVRSVLDGAGTAAEDSDGASNQTPPGNDNPISPKDGAGPRAANPHALARAREQEIEQLRKRR